MLSGLRIASGTFEEGGLGISCLPLPVLLSGLSTGNKTLEEQKPAKYNHQSRMPLNFYLQFPGARTGHAQQGTRQDMQPRNSEQILDQNLEIRITQDLTMVSTAPALTDAQLSGLYAGKFRIDPATLIPLRPCRRAPSPPKFAQVRS